MYSGRLIRWLAGLFGSHLVDEETGRLLGRAFIIPWRGQVLLIGYTGLEPLRPVARSDRRPNYWKLSVPVLPHRESLIFPTSDDRIAAIDPRTCRPGRPDGGLLA